MIREKIKEELAKKKWTVQKLSDVTEVRYASLSEYLKGKKELTTKNLEIVLRVLELQFEGDTASHLKQMLKEFDGTNLPGNHIINQERFAFSLLGVLVFSAAEHLQCTMPEYKLNLGDIWDRFIETIEIDEKNTIDIRGSLMKRDFIRIAADHFNELERNAVSLLLGYELPNSCDWEKMQIVFMGALFSKLKL